MMTFYPPILYKHILILASIIKLSFAIYIFALTFLAECTYNLFFSIQNGHFARRGHGMVILG